MSNVPQRLRAIELYAWLGEDELGSGEIGLKQGRVPAGVVPLVAVIKAKVLSRDWQMEDQSQRFGKKIYLCRFVLEEVVTTTTGGEPL